MDQRVPELGRRRPQQAGMERRIRRSPMSRAEQFGPDSNGGPMSQLSRRDVHAMRAYLETL